VVTDEVAIGFARKNDLGDAVLALFMDARAHGPELDLTASFLLVGADTGDGGPELLGVFEFSVDDASTPRQRWLKLLGLTDDRDDFWPRQSCRHDFNGHLPSGGILRQQRPSGRYLPELRESLGEFAAEAIEFADWDNESAFEVCLDFADFVTCIA